MASFTLEEIKKASGGKILYGDNLQVIAGVSTNSRSISQGELFIPLVGETFDGHAFLDQAIAKGASAVLVSEPEKRPADESVPVILVKNTKLALERIAEWHRKRFSIPVVAITGSNGKTTTKDMITSILRSKYKVCATPFNFNNEIGLSKTILHIEETTDICVTEMGMRGFGQIAELCSIAHPTIGVITNVGTSHIGLLGSRENIGKAKKELIDALPAEGTAVLNQDDALVKQMGDTYVGKVIGYGIHGKYPVHASAIEYTEAGTEFVCHCFDEAFKVKLPLFGEHNVYDALAAIATARILGVSAVRIAKALDAFQTEGSRQRIMKINGITVVDDSYNANPLSMEMALRAAMQLRGNKRFLILGDMGELGDNAAKYHYELGKKAGQMGFDGLIALGTLSRNTADGAEDAGVSIVNRVMSCEDAASAIAKLATSDDVVLIKGSHAMHMDQIPEIWKGTLNTNGNQ